VDASTRAFGAAILIAGLIAGSAAAAEQGAAPVERRSAGAERIGLMIFPPLLWRPPTVGDEVERRTLSNGITLYLYPDRTLPLLDLVGLIRGGRLYDPGEKAGLARVAASQIRAGGTTSIAPDALNDELESLAASLELSAGDEALEVRLNLLSRHTERGVKLLADVLLRPTFDAGQLELARGRLLEELRRRRDNPTELLHKEFGALHYTDRHPLGLEPSEASLRSISREDLVAFHRRYVRPDNLMLAAAGDFDTESLVALLEQSLGSWSANGRSSLPPVPNVETTAKPGVYLIDRPIPQSSISIGHFGVDRTNPDRQAIELMNQLLGGGGFTSRITKRVRSAEGLAYSVGSRFGTDGRQPGLFQVIALTRTDGTARAVGAILDEIKRLRDAPVPATELDAAKEALTNSFLFWFADPTQSVRRLMLLEFEGLPPDYYQTLLGRYRAVTSDRLQEVARRYVKPDDLAIVVVGDAKILEPALARFGPVKRISAAVSPSLAPQAPALSLPHP
jgi:predicted Zn-dependent peptidase